MTAQSLERRAFNTKEVQRITGLSEKLVRDALREGRLRHVRLGRRILISNDAISDFLHGEQMPNAVPNHR